MYFLNFIYVQKDRKFNTIAITELNVLNHKKIFNLKCYGNEIDIF